MKQTILRYHKHFFYGSWLLLNLLQSAATGLLDDEAYYWVYAQFPAWGYFDHPPMIAWMIKAGYSIFQNELGVRIVAAIMSTATLYLIEKLLNKKDDRLFYTIALSIGIIQVGGIMAVPDTPLMFFTAMFFWVYKKFLDNKNALNIFLLGLSIALLFYSKYHGLLVVLLTLASNPKLLLRYQAWMVALVALTLFLPHIFWQYQNGFPSVHFHLFERNAPAYRPSFTLEYIGAQIALAGPLAGWIFLWAAFKRRPADLLEKALKYATTGIYIFFLISTLKGRSEGNWTLPAFIGLIVLSHQYLFDKFRLRVWLARLAAVTIVLILGVRLFFLTNYLKPFGKKDGQVHNNKEWATDIQRFAIGKTIFFVDSYQRASKYWFYTGTPAFSLNTVNYRRNNFNFWKMEDTIQGEPVYAIYQGKHQDYFSDSIPTAKGIYLGRDIPDYFSFSRLRFDAKDVKGRKGEQISVPLKVRTDPESLQRIVPPYDSARVYVALYKYVKDDPAVLQTELKVRFIKQKNEEAIASFKLPDTAGKYVIRFAVGSCLRYPSMNSSVIRLRVTE